MLLAVSIQHMVKKISQYIIGYLIALVVLGFVAMFVPPVWVACPCVFNVVKSLIVFPGSLIGVVVVLVSTVIFMRLGRTFWRAFGISLGGMSIIFIILGFSTSYIADFIESSDWLSSLSIFQVTYPIDMPQTPSSQAVN